MLAHHLYCAESDERALEIAKPPLDRYLQSIYRAAKRWTTDSGSADYPGYDKIIAGLGEETTESQMEKGGAFIGSPETVAERLADYLEQTGGFDIASLQVNFNDLPVDVAEASMRLFAEKVMPRFAD